MSRSGKIPVSIPKGVEVTVSGRVVSVKGAKGSQKMDLPAGVNVKVEGGHIEVSAENLDRETKRSFGLTRALLQNMVTGLSSGFEKKLEMVGVGYRAAVKGKSLDLQIGTSHPTGVEIPEGVAVKIEEGIRIVISGADRQKVGQFAATVRGMKPPEPYKGKGIRYVNEHVRRKAGKAAAAKK